MQFTEWGLGCVKQKELLQNSYCQSATELREKCSWLDPMALFPNTVNADTGPVLVFCFVLFHCCRGGECMCWEEEVKVMKAAGLCHSKKEWSLPSLQFEYPINCNTSCRRSGKKKSGLDPYSLPTPLCPRLLLNTVGLASRTMTFKAANRKPGVLSDGDMERKG